MLTAERSLPSSPRFFKKRTERRLNKGGTENDEDLHFQVRSKSSIVTGRGEWQGEELRPLNLGSDVEGEDQE